MKKAYEKSSLWHYKETLLEVSYEICLLAAYRPGHFEKKNRAA